MDPETVSAVTGLDMSITRAVTPARAMVCAHGVDTTYLRAGRGDAIVLVANDLEAQDVQDLMQELARQFLVIAAAPTPAQGQIANWLRDFLEGLGLTGAHVLMHASLTQILMADSTNA